MQRTDDLKAEEQTLQCAEHGPYTARILEMFGVRRVPDCPECYKANQRKASDLAERQEAEKRKMIVSLNLESSGIPKRFRDKTFDNFKAENPDSARVLKIARAYADRFDERRAAGGCLVFTGLPGTGKNHLAFAIMEHAIRVHMATAYFTTVIDAVRSIRETFGQKSETTEREAISKLVSPELLVLDEVGVQGGSDYEKNVVFDVFNKRYNAMKPTILISNLTQSELTDYLGERVIDRMREGGTATLAFTWESYRGRSA